MQALGLLPSFWWCSSCLSFSRVIDDNKVSHMSCAFLLCIANIKIVTQSLCALWSRTLLWKLLHLTVLNAFQSKSILAYLLLVLTVVFCVGIWIYASPGAGRMHAQYELTT